jgi:hypothetical protein
MKKARNITALLRLCVVTPIFMYLAWWVLTQLHAGDLQMFLFWVYVPVTVLCIILSAVAESGNTES